jgi:hypothetical protein
VFRNQLQSMFNQATQQQSNDLMVQSSDQLQLQTISQQIANLQTRINSLKEQSQQSEINLNAQNEVLGIQKKVLNLK